MSDNKELSLKELCFGTSALVWTAVGVLCLGMYGCPRFNVYSQEMEGKANYAKAQQNRNIVVLEAKAKMDAAIDLAEAEVNRAKGVARANAIIGESLKDNEAYLRYLWIHSLQEGKNEVIYVPTEANLPILEASRKAKHQ